MDITVFTEQYENINMKDIKVSMFSSNNYKYYHDLYDNMTTLTTKKFNDSYVSIKNNTLNNLFYSHFFDNEKDIYKNVLFETEDLFSVIMPEQFKQLSISPYRWILLLDYLNNLDIIKNFSKIDVSTNNIISDNRNDFSYLDVMVLIFESVNQKLEFIFEYITNYLETDSFIDYIIEENNLSDSVINKLDIKEHFSNYKYTYNYNSYMKIKILEYLKERV